MQATRPLAVGSHTGIDRVGTGAAAADAEQDKQPAVGKRGASKDFDISRMAPKLHDSRYLPRHETSFVSYVYILYV